MQHGKFALGPLPAGSYGIWSGDMMSAVHAGDVLLTAVRDEDAGDVMVKPR